MSTLSSPGRLFYALAVTLIGIQFIIYSDFNSTLFPLQPLLTGKNLVLRSFGIITVLCGFAMGIEKFAGYIKAPIAMASTSADAVHADPLRGCS